MKFYSKWKGCRLIDEHVEVEDQDYIDAITPFAGNDKKGCYFRAVYYHSSNRLVRIALEPGCCLYVNLVQGATGWFLNKWVDNGKKPFEINVNPDMHLAMVRVEPCRRCGGSVHIDETEIEDASCERPA